MKNSIIVISGGNGGIGRNVVKKFLENGDKVIVLDVMELEDKQITNNENYLYIKTDVTNIEHIKVAKEVLQTKFGYIDNFISMAGINMKSELGGIEEITLEDIDKSIKLNLNSHIYMIKFLLELWKKSESDNKTFTMISSINAISDYGLPAYSAAKSGMYGLMNSITRPMGKLGIRVNTISLGTVPHQNEKIEGVEHFEGKLDTLALGRFVTPTDVADTLYSLIYITKGIVGQNIILDMGQSI